MKWHRTVRSSGLVEHVCAHGTGHPDPESARRIAEKMGHDHGTWLAHGCDGCCTRRDFPGHQGPGFEIKHESEETT